MKPYRYKNDRDPLKTTALFSELRARSTIKNPESKDGISLADDFGSRIH